MQGKIIDEVFIKSHVKKRKTTYIAFPAHHLCRMKRPVVTAPVMDLSWDTELEKKTH